MIIESSNRMRTTTLNGLFILRAPCRKRSHEKAELFGPKRRAFTGAGSEAPHWQVLVV